MTIARPALAAMCLPMTGTCVTIVPPSGNLSSNLVNSARSSSTVRVHSASIPGVDEIVVTGILDASTTRLPHSVSSETSSALRRNRG